MQEEIIKEIEEKILNLLLFDEIILNQDKQKIITNTHKYFFSQENVKLFEIIEKMYKKEKQINIFTFLNEIKETKLEHYFDNTLLIIQTTIPLITQINYYLQSLFDNCLEKLIIKAKNKKDVEEIEEIKNNFNPLTDKLEHISSGSENWQERYKQKEKTSVFSYYHELDEIIGCFQGGDYITLGGATGQGKTMFALNLATNILIQDKKVLYCSLEMPLEQLQNRFNCLTSEINANKIRQYNFDLEEIKRYDEGMKHLKEWPLYVTTDYKLTIEKLENYIVKCKPDFVIIDYLGLMSINGNHSLYEKTTYLSRQLKVLATQYNIPILILVQLNREIKNREDKRPMLSDIRESGAIEQDSDFVIFVYREYVYNQMANKNKIEIIISKNRHGEAGKIINLNLDLQTQRIKDV